MKIGLMAVICLAGVCVTGCTTGSRGSDKNMQVVIEGGGRFPAALAGRWQADQDGWQFVIEPDGGISSAVISFGRVEVKPGQITTSRALAGGNAVFEPGEWMVDYIPSTHELTIKISMSHVRVETGDNIIDGRSTDIFIGKVDAEEGFWPVEWTAFSHYTTRMVDKPVAEVATDPDKGEAKPLIFRKAPPRR